MTTNKKINLLIAFFLILIVLMISFIVFPLFQEIKKNSQELISQKEKFAALETKIVTLEEFRLLYQDKEFEKITQKINDLFVNPAAPVELISFLEKSSTEQHLKIEILPTSGREIAKDLWPYLTFQITSTGYFPNFLAFLERIESSPYLVEIKNLNINKLSNSNDIQAKLPLKVYSQ